MQQLKKKLPKKKFVIYDFDQVGVPPNADKIWRLKTTDHWLKQAKENNINGKSTIICGVCVPSEIEHSLQKPDLPFILGL